MEYRTEEEQLERLKKLWSSYGSYIFYGAAIIFALVYGAKTWKSRQESALEKSSSLYTRSYIAYTDGNDSEFQAISNQLLTDYPKSIYSDFIRLILAKESLKNKKYNEAEMYLLHIVNAKKKADVKDSMQQIASVRLARIYLAQGKSKLASEQADKLKDTGFDIFAHEIYGDINLMNEEYEAAQKEYKVALEKQNKKFPGTSSILRNKLQFLSKKISENN